MENKLSECEEIIYSILLKAGRDLTVPEIMEQAKNCFGREWKFQTVATFLERMKKKGCVSVCKIGRYSHFHPEVSLEDYRRQKLSEIRGFLLFEDNKEMAEFVKKM